MVKAVQKIIDQHSAQLWNYMKATKFEVGVLLNFGPKATFQRRVFDNERKGTLSWVKK